MSDTVDKKPLTVDQIQEILDLLEKGMKEAGRSIKTAELAHIGENGELVIDEIIRDNRKPEDLN